MKRLGPKRTRSLGPLQLAGVLALLAALASCSDSSSGRPDAAYHDGGAVDVGRHDTFQPDVNGHDTASLDGGDTDTGAFDAGVADGSPADANSADSSAADAGAPRCTPFVEPSQAGCELDQVCWPDMALRGVGTCIPSWAGTAQQGDTCDGQSEATTCSAPDLLCLAQADGSSTCELICDPLASGNEPGQCPSGQGCAALELTSGALAYGTCIASCVYTHGSPFAPAVPCSGGGICAPGFLYEVAFDVCVADYAESLSNAPLDAGAACPQGADYAYCRPNGLCLDAGDGLQCLDLCDVSVGGFGSASHPDCSQAGAVCTDLFGASGFGVCVVP